MLLRALVAQLLRKAAHQQMQEMVDQQIDDMERVRAERSEARIKIVVQFADKVESIRLADQMGARLVTQCANFLERSGTLAGHTIAVIESGTGQQASRQALIDFIQIHKPKLVFAAGFAASLSDDLGKGDLFFPSKIEGMDGRVLDCPLMVSQSEIDAKSNWHSGLLYSVDRALDSNADWAALSKRTDATVVDSETFSIVELCQHFEIAVVPVRIITDHPLSESEDDPFKVVSKQKTLAAKAGAAAGALWKRPKVAIDFLKLKRSALNHSDQLANLISGLIEQIPVSNHEQQSQSSESGES